MKTQVSELADNRVRLDIEVPAGDVDHAFDHALSDLSQSVRVPGFRKGKAPKPLVMRQVGRDTVIEEALRDHLTGWYSRAVAEVGIDPIDRPTIDWTDEPAEGAPFAFTAEVEVKAPPEVKSYKGLDGVKPPRRGARRGGRRRDRAAAADRGRAGRGRARRAGRRLPRHRLRGQHGRQAVRGRRRVAVRRRAGRRPAGGGARARPGRHEGGGGARRRADHAGRLRRRAPGREGRELPRQAERRQGTHAAGARRRVRDVGERVRHARRAARGHHRARARRCRGRGRAAVPLVGARLARRRALRRPCPTPSSRAACRA